MSSTRRVEQLSLVAALVLGASISLGQTRVSTGQKEVSRGVDASRTLGAIKIAATPWVATDREDYAPGETVLVTGGGFEPNDAITMQVIHLTGAIPDGEGHGPYSITSDEAGQFAWSWFLHPDDSGNSTFLLTADGAAGQHAEVTFTDTIPGHGVVTSVTPNDGGCVAVGANSSTTVWDVQPGKTYTVIIEGVDDAANGGTDATMPFFLQNTVTGNLCLTGQQVAVGVYSVQITIPLYACETSPINYGICDAATARRARGNAADAVPSTTTNGVHLRANATCAPSGVVSCSSVEACCEDTGVCNNRTISNCLNTTAGHAAGTPMGPGSTCSTTTCEGRREDCTIDCAAEFTADCNGSTDPTSTGSAICSGTCTASTSDSSVEGTCPQEQTITRTWTCTSPDGGASASCEQTIHVVDTTPPVVTCPDDCEVECGEAVCITPICDTESCACGGEPSCTDDCGECSISGSCFFIPDGCPTVVAGVTPPPKTGTLVKTFSSSDGASTVADAGCPNVGTCTQTIRIVDTRAPVIIECPGDFTIDCSETPVFGEPVCEDSCDTCHIELAGDDVVTPGSCPQESSVTRCWVAVDNCGNRSEPCCQTITSRDTTPPVITCPEDCQVECGATDCAEATCDDANCSCGGEASCTDDCGDCSVSQTCEFFPGGCESVVAGVTPPPKTGTMVKTFFGSDGASTVAGGGCPNTASCEQRVQIVDTTPPSITCSGNLVVQPDAGKCCATVRFDTQATDTCDETLTVSCSVDSGSCVGIGTTTVNCSATDDCTNSDDCSFTVTVPTSICGFKKYDANGDGVGETGIAGWKVKLSGAASATAYTDSTGKYCFNGLAPGNYTVTEFAPNSSWLNTSPTSCSFPELTCPGSCAFNNLCLGAGGGLTLGFWSNKNGQARMNDGGTMAPELALLSGLCLRNGSGADYNPTTYASFRDWLLKATATNMAYMLSAQLAAMELNVESGGVAGGSILYAPGCGGFVSVNDLMTAANAALCADGNTPDGDPNRALQECLKNALDRGNNNLNFVQTTACPFAPY